MPAIRSLVLVLAVAASGGCSWFGWLPWVDKDEAAAKLEPVELTRIDATVRVDRVWSADIGKGLGRKYLMLRPAVAADRVFAADGYGVVEARDRFTGKRIWRANIDTEPRKRLRAPRLFDRRDPSFLAGGVGLAHGYVLLGTTRGEVVALSAADGTPVWRVQLGAEILAPPVGGAELVFVQTEDGRLIALERTNGAVRWSYDNPVPVLTLRGTSMPVFGGGLVYAGFANGMIAAIRAETGEPVWEHRVMLPEGRSELERMVDIDSTPVLAGGLVFVVSYQGRLKALRATDGALLWEQELSSFLDLAAGFRQVFVVDQIDTVLAYDQQSAERLWSQEGLLRRQLSSPVALGEYVLVGDSEGYLHVLSQANGEFVGRRRVDRKGVRSPMVAADGVVYVLGNSGSLQALEIKAR
ncbi:MAG: outer membrane protein assembly factor BamB [Pseudomonadales bacterium]|nr:outer membrane protein assembly factor BamB [Pseudomonadales bacterium]